MGEHRDVRRPDSLAPVALEGVDIDAEAAAMNKGRGRMIAAGAAMLALIGIGAGWMMSGLDETRAFAAANEALTEIDRTAFDRFWGCALEGVPLSNLETESDLVYQVRLRSSENGIRYARLVNQRCLEALDDVENGLGAIVPPEELEPRIRNLKESVAGLRGAWKEYIEFMTGSTGSYDEVRARPYLERIGRGWSKFTREYRETKQTIREHEGL